MIAIQTFFPKVQRCGVSKLLKMHYSKLLGVVAVITLSAGAGCSSRTEEDLAQTQGALLNSDQFLYFTCNATGWNPAERRVGEPVRPAANGGRRPTPEKCHRDVTPASPPGEIFRVSGIFPAAG